MKTMRFLFITGAIIMITMPCTMVQSQDTEPGQKADPDVKWDVIKEYDEQGTLIYYDSACSRTCEHRMIPYISFIQNGNNCPGSKKILPGVLKFKIFSHIRVALANSILIAGIQKQFTNYKLYGHQN